MMSKLECWYEFASTYSYLSVMRIDAASAAAGVEIVWRPFLLGPIFQAQGWSTSPFKLYPAKGAYMWRDLARRAAAYGLPPITRPDPFPQNGLLAARLAQLGLDSETFWGPAFTRAVYRAQFAEGAAIGDAEILGGILEQLGLPAGALIEQARTDQTAKDALRASTERAQALGLFGAPSFTTEDGELFWGDDRLEDAIAWATGSPPR